MMILDSGLLFLGHPVQYIYSCIALCRHSAGWQAGSN